ncbi:MAG: hypothetical protein D6687_06220 [Acidobacteria bacterium]|nr:MAG: hypothetical protein D6687_06220 [Acidobacteriota bacterium]
MIKVKDWIIGILALIFAVVAFFSFRQYQESGDATMFWVTIVFVVLTIVSAGIFLAKKFSKREEIHITQ